LLGHWLFVFGAHRLAAPARSWKKDKKVKGGSGGDRAACQRGYVQTHNIYSAGYCTTYHRGTEHLFYPSVHVSWIYCLLPIARPKVSTLRLWRSSRIIFWPPPDKACPSKNSARSVSSESVSRLAVYKGLSDPTLGWFRFFLRFKLIKIKTCEEWKAYDFFWRCPYFTRQPRKVFLEKSSVLNLFLPSIRMRFHSGKRFLQTFSFARQEVPALMAMEYEEITKVPILKFFWIIHSIISIGIHTLQQGAMEPCGYHHNLRTSQITPNYSKNRKRSKFLFPDVVIRFEKW